MSVDRISKGTEVPAVPLAVTPQFILVMASHTQNIRTGLCACYSKNAMFQQLRMRVHNYVHVVYNVCTTRVLAGTGFF